jgi:hypothetical protein
MIIIEDTIIDDNGKTKVALTFQQNTPKDIRVRYSSYSNSITVPATQNNTALYGLPNNVTSISPAPYTSKEAKYISNGIEVFKGFAKIVSAGDTLRFNLFDTTLTFFDLIRDKLLSQLVFENATSFVDTNQDTLRNATSEVVAPVMSYGLFDDATSNINADFNLPSVYYHSVIERIFIEAGYAYDGDIFDHDQYLKLIIPYSRPNFEYDDAFAADRNFRALVNGLTISLAGAGTTQIATFPTLVSEGSLSFWDGVDEYTVGTGLGYSFKSKFLLVGSIFFNTMTATSITIAIRSGVGNLGFTTISASGAFVVETSFTTLGSLATDIYVEITQNGAGAVSAGFSANFYSEVSKEIDRTIFNAGSIMPDFKQVDLISDFLIRFNLLVKEKNGTLYFKSVDEIMTDHSRAVDWTNKREMSIQDEIDLTPSGYAQSNYFRYSKADDLTNTYTGEGNFSIPNDGLPLSQQYYKSAINSTKDELIGDILMAHVPVYETSVDPLVFDNEPGIRLLMVRDRRSDEPAVTYDATPRTDYLVAYFEDSIETYDATYRSFLETHYDVMMQAFETYKSVSRVYKLNDLDISSLDLFVPVFDKDSYFVVNVIKNYISGQKVGVEMLKV